MRLRCLMCGLLLPVLALAGGPAAAADRPLLGLVAVHHLAFTDLTSASGPIPSEMQQALAVGFVQTAPLPPTPEMLALAVGYATSPVGLAGRTALKTSPAEGRAAAGAPPPGWLGSSLQKANIPRHLYLTDGRPSLFRLLLAGTDDSAGEIGVEAGSPATWGLGDFQTGLAVIEMPPVTGAAEIRDLLERLTARIDGLWILGLSPGPGSLLPCARWQPGHPAGVLFSASTRTAGLLVPADLTADLAAALQLANPPLGRPLMVRPYARPGPFALAIRLAAAAADRRRLMLALGGMLLGGAIILGLLAAAGRQPAARFVLAVLTGLPGTFALVPANLGPAAPALALAAALALAGLAFLLYHDRGPLIAGGLTALLLLGDLVLGSPLGRLAVLGFAPHLGYRYYGLGNEAMALVIGGGLIALGGWPAGGSRRGGWLILALAAIVSHPLLGANVGGGLTALIALGCWWAAEGDRRRLWLLPSVIILLGLVNYATEIVAGRASHFGTVLAGLGPGDLRPLLQAKLWSMARVITSPLSWLGLAALAVFIHLAFRRCAGVLDGYPHLRRAMNCAMIAAIGGSLANDSAVAVGVLLAWPALTAWLWVLVQTRQPRQG